MTINIVLMAGLGKRFSDAGYLLPKPLIAVSGSTMLSRAIATLPPADSWMFVVRPEHVADFDIEQEIKKIVPTATIVVDEHPTGQLNSALTVRSLVQDDDQIVIAPCDFACLHDATRYQNLLKRPEVGAVMWTFTERGMLASSPQSWGWYETAKDSDVVRSVSVKKPISDQPFFDHAAVGLFTFKRAGDFFRAADKLIAAGNSVNGEYYVDSVPVYLKEIGVESAIFDVDLYVGWGRPADLHEYEYLEYAVQTGHGKLTEEQQRLLPLWKRYFATIGV